MDFLHLSFFVDESNERHIGRGRSKSELSWKGSSRIARERQRSREDTSDDAEDDVSARPRASSQRLSNSPDVARIGRSQYTNPYDSISRGRDSFHREPLRARNYLNDVYEDDESVYRYSFEAIHQERKGRWIARSEVDTVDDSSASSSLNVERGTSRRLEQSIDPSA